MATMGQMGSLWCRHHRHRSNPYRRHGHEAVVLGPVLITRQLERALFMDAKLDLRRTK
jgi:hypothetical protein